VQGTALCSAVRHVGEALDTLLTSSCCAQRASQAERPELGDSGHAGAGITLPISARFAFPLRESVVGGKCPRARSGRLKKFNARDNIAFSTAWLSYQPMLVQFEFQVDDPTRSIRVKSVGTWTLGDVERYCVEFRDHFATARARFGDVRVLVDGREASTGDVEVSKRLGELGALFDRPGDRFAVVTPSSLRKQQAGRDGLPSSGMAFVSVDAAEMWLLAHD